MTNISNRRGILWGSIAIVLVGLGCGGRTSDDQADPGSSGAGGSSDMPTTPPPTCEEICQHVVGACFPGASTEPCTKDCQSTVAQYTGCKSLDPYLRCLPAVHVLCEDMKATIDGCNNERVALESCHSP